MLPEPAARSVRPRKFKHRLASAMRRIVALRVGISLMLRPETKLRSFERNWFETISRSDREGMKRNFERRVSGVLRQPVIINEWSYKGPPIGTLKEGRISRLT